MVCRAAHTVEDVAFAPDGRTLAVTSSVWGEALELFDLQTAARLWKHSSYRSPLARVTFSDDGRRLAFGDGLEQATVLAADDGRVLRRVHLAAKVGHCYTEACITPDGAQLAVATGSRVRIHDVDSGDKIVEIDHGRRSCHGIAFSPDGTCMATAADDGIHLWDATTGHAGHWLWTPTRVQTVRFNRCGHAVTAVGHNGAVRSWDARTGVQSVQRVPSVDFYAVTLSPDALLALTIGQRTLHFCDVRTGHEWAAAVDIGRRRAVGLAYDRRLLAVGAGRDVKIWDTESLLPTPSANTSTGSCCWCGLANHDPRLRRQALHKSRATTHPGGTPSAAERQPTRPPPTAIGKATSAVGGPAVLPTNPALRAHDAMVGPMTRLERTGSVLRAGAFGISAALLGAAASAALVVGTGEYDTSVTYALLGFIVAVAVGVARPAIRPGWMQALSLVLTLAGLLLSQYVIARHFSGLTDAPLLLPLHETVTLLQDQFAANLIVLVCAGFALLTAAAAPAYIEPALSRRQWIHGPAGWLTATAAAVTGLVTLALLTGARLGATNPNRGPNAASRGTAAPTSTIDVAFDQVKAGDCYNNPPSDSPDTLPELPCQQPHDGQVFFVFTMPAGEYPGDDAVDASADHTCGDQFASLDDQLTWPLDYDYFTPANDAWEAGSRATQCALVRTDGDKLDDRVRVR